MSESRMDPVVRCPLCGLPVDDPTKERICHACYVHLIESRGVEVRTDGPAPAAPTDLW